MTDEAKDVMQEPWCCLTCNAVFVWGRIRMKGGGLHCPKCDSENLHPADSGTHELEDYVGEVGTLN